MSPAFPLAILGLALLGACRAGEPAQPPAAEFLVSAGDSTYWVRPASNGLRLRGSPLLLARFDGRFHEVYVTEDERAYEDATFIGQRVWRRDLVRGDSVLVFEDTLAPSMARRWVADNPDARLLPAGEPHPEEPAAAASVEVAVVAVHGSYISLEYHADVESGTEDPWHTTRRMVVDLRSGRQVSVADLFGAEAAQRVVTAARRSYVAALDSISGSSDDRAAVLARALDDFSFDPASFTLGGDGGQPTVAFHVPGRGEGEAGDLAIPLPELPVPAPGWWADIRPALPASSDDAAEERWEHAGFAVTAEDHGEIAALALHAGNRSWGIGAVQLPVHQILWLDTPAIDSVARRGLRRAFDEAVFYDETMRTAAHDPVRSTPSSPTMRTSKPVSESQHETSELMMPQDANNLGHVFGGVVLAMMDKVAAIAAFRHSRTNVVTASIDRVDFREPIHVGDLVVMKASVNFAGRTSMEVGVRVEAEDLLSGRRRHTNSCYLTFVAIDRNGRPIEVPELRAESDEDKRRETAAGERRRRRLEERESERQQGGNRPVPGDAGSR
jgi:acyl-CoA hydrolase